MSIYSINNKHLTDIKSAKNSVTGGFFAHNSIAAKPETPPEKSKIELDLEAQGMLGRSQIIYRNTKQNQDISFGKTETNPLKTNDKDSIQCEIDEISEHMPDLSKGSIKKLKNFIKRDETGYERDFEGYSIKKISENKIEITKKVQEIPKTQQETPKTTEEMVEAILNCGHAYKSSSVYENFEAEILALAGTDESKIALIYDTLVQTPEDGSNVGAAEVIKGLSKYKTARFRLFNALLRKSKTPDLKQEDNDKIINKYGKDDIKSAWRQIKKLQKFLNNFELTENTELYRTDKYDILENVEVNSGKYKGQKLAKLLQNHASGKEKIDLEELSKSLKNQDIVQEGFLSTSIIELGAKEYDRADRPILWKFETQGTTNGCYIDLFGDSLNKEYECLINSGAKINVQNITQDDEGQWIIEATVTNSTK